jgi:hypothetical protein
MPWKTAEKPRENRVTLWISISITGFFEYGEHFFRINGVIPK